MPMYDQWAYIADATKEAHALTRVDLDRIVSRRKAVYQNHSIPGVQRDQRNGVEEIRNKAPIAET